MRSTDIRGIAFVGNYLPRKCGIATFTKDMYGSISHGFPEIDCFVVPVNDRSEGYDYPEEVRFAIDEQEIASYRKAAEFINESGADLVSLQHEFGIFGGPAGSHVLELTSALRIPVVTTLHTVLRNPNADQLRVLKQIAEASAQVVVMTCRARDMLEEIYDVPPAKIEVIAHGIPNVPFDGPQSFKERLGLTGRSVALTFGLLSPNKGIETMLSAVPAILEKFPDFAYVVLGATHPELVRQQGERYRESLHRLAGDLGITNHVVFCDRFVELDELTAYIRAADIYVTPYLNPAQITSGTLAYAFGCGKPIVSTPYWHAEELLQNGLGALVPFSDSKALSREIVGLLSDDRRRTAMSEKAYELGRDMIWEKSAIRYHDAFRLACNQWPKPRRKPMPVMEIPEQGFKTPRLRLGHLLRMTDSTGMLQHATYSIPNLTEGYCTDDNARALILTVQLEELGAHERIADRLATRYASFLDAALNPETNRFRNFLGFDRRWLEEAGSEDSHGRALWALGTCAGRTRNPNLRAWAAALFGRSLPVILGTTSPRTWAFGLLGLQNYALRFDDDKSANKVRDVLTARLIDLFERSAELDWPWFEHILSYDLGRVPQALIAVGNDTGNDQAMEIGLRALRWLLKVQSAPIGHFRPIGSDGFYRRGHARAQFDQQPIEANAMVSACSEAYRATGDDEWPKAARIAFDWFLGGNDLGLRLYDPTTHGCCDGLHENRVNRNQGAESTLAFLMSIAELKLAETKLSESFRPEHSAV
jgi:glycosyltransferase involved in cell wall biosynthesis